jgi:hypothetical protein
MDKESKKTKVNYYEHIGRKVAGVRWQAAGRRESASGFW